MWSSAGRARFFESLFGEVLGYLADAPEKIRSEGIRPPAIVVIGSVAAFGI